MFSGADCHERKIICRFRTNDPWSLSGLESDLNRHGLRRGIRSPKVRGSLGRAAAPGIHLRVWLNRPTSLRLSRPGEPLADRLNADVDHREENLASPTYFMDVRRVCRSNEEF